VFRVDDGVPNRRVAGPHPGRHRDAGELPLDLAGRGASYVAIVSPDLRLRRRGDRESRTRCERFSLTLRIENQGCANSPCAGGVLQGSGYFVGDGTRGRGGDPPLGGGGRDAFKWSKISPDCPEIYTGQLTLAADGPGSYQASATSPHVGPWLDTARWISAGPSAWPGTPHQRPVGALEPHRHDLQLQRWQPEDDHTADPGHVCFVDRQRRVGAPRGE